MLDEGQPSPEPAAAESQQGGGGLDQGRPGKGWCLVEGDGESAPPSVPAPARSVRRPRTSPVSRQHLPRPAAPHPRLVRLYRPHPVPCDCRGQVPHLSNQPAGSGDARRTGRDVTAGR